MNGRLSKQKYAEEYLTHIAEKIITDKELTQAEKGVWQQVVDFIRGGIKKLIKSDFNVPLTDKQIADIIKASVGSLYEKTAVPEKETVAKALNNSREVSSRIGCSYLHLLPRYLSQRKKSLTGIRT